MSCTAPRCRYIVCKGAVALVDQRGSLAALVGAGEHFGERGLTAAAAPRTHRAVALRPCDVVLLSRWDLQVVWIKHGRGLRRGPQRVSRATWCCSAAVSCKWRRTW